MTMPNKLQDLLGRVLKRNEEDNNAMAPIQGRTFDVTQEEYDSAVKCFGSDTLMGRKLIVVKNITRHPGWKPEGFMREKLTPGNVYSLWDEVEQRASDHFRDFGNGIFTHPHEIVGCMYGQLMKLSAAADESIYTGDLDDFRERCMKTLFAILCGTMSVDKLKELRDK